MVRWIALFVSLAIAPTVAAADESGESTAASGTDPSEGDDSRASNANDPERAGEADPSGESETTESSRRARSSDELRRPRVRITFAEPGTLLAPIVAELMGLGVEVERDEASSVSRSDVRPSPPVVPRPVAPPPAARSGSSVTSVPRARDEAPLDGWVRLVAPGPTRFVVEIWLVAPTLEHVATIEANDEAPASVALRSVELMRAALVGARAFRRAPVVAPVSEAPPPPARVEAPPTPASSPRANVGAVLGAGLGASPGGGVVPLAALGLSLRLRAPIELALTAGIPIAESRTHVDEGRVDVRVVPLDVSVRYAPRFGIVGLTLGAALGATVTRVAGSTTDEALLGRSRRTTGATFAGIVGGGVSLGETVELIAEARVGRFFSALDVRVGERTVRTWAAWMQAILGLRIRLVGGAR